MFLFSLKSLIWIFNCAPLSGQHLQTPPQTSTSFSDKNNRIGVPWLFSLSVPFLCRVVIVSRRRFRDICHEEQGLRYRRMSHLCVELSCGDSFPHKKAMTRPQKKVSRGLIENLIVRTWKFAWNNFHDLVKNFTSDVGFFHISFAFQHETRNAWTCS